MSAFLKQKLGYNQTYRLDKGIIGYNNWVNQRQELNSNTAFNDSCIDISSKPELIHSIQLTDSVSSNRGHVSSNALKSLFVGNNYLFDNRRFDGVEESKLPPFSSKQKKV